MGDRGKNKSPDCNDRAQAGTLPLDPEDDAYIVSVPPNMHALGFKLTDLGNAERLVARYRDRMRYCPPRRRWLLWNGVHWAWDETGVIVRLAKATVRSIYREAADCQDDETRKALVKHARASENGGAIDRMIRLAQTEIGVPVLLSELDADPWVLNCRNGTLDLRTGTLRNHDRRQLITKCTGVDYSPDARSELWDRVLNDAVGGDVELAAYLQRVLGYALVGEASERAFFFLCGPAGTAKSTVVEAGHAALGDYARSADFDTWVQQSNVGGNRGDLVRLAGARLVSSVEVRRGARWDEALIKRVTGGDEIVAAAKFEAEVTFRPAFTLILAANDAPQARDDDEGLWARIRKIPLTSVIPPEKQDRTIKAKLRQPEHAAAILAWAVRGCLAWQKDGLGSARAVDESTAAYRADQDRFGEFVRDCLAFDAGARITRKALREAYEAWGKETGVRALLSAKEIAKRLRDRGCDERKREGVWTWIGLRLSDVRDDEEPGQQTESGAARGTTPREVQAQFSYVGTLGNGAPKCPVMPRTVSYHDGEYTEEY